MTIPEKIKNQKLFKCVLKANSPQLPIHIKSIKRTPMGLVCVTLLPKNTSVIKLTGAEIVKLNGPLSNVSNSVISLWSELVSSQFR